MGLSVSSAVLLNVPDHRREQDGEVVRPTRHGPKVQEFVGEDPIHRDRRVEQDVVDLEDETENDVVETLHGNDLGKYQLRVERLRRRRRISAAARCTALGRGRRRRHIRSRGGTAGPDGRPRRSDRGRAGHVGASFRHFILCIGCLEKELPC